MAHSILICGSVLIEVSTFLFSTKLQSNNYFAEGSALVI